MFHHFMKGTPVPKEQRIYVVTDVDDQRLIKARSSTKAAHYAASNLQVRLASQNDLVRLLSEGVEVEDADQPKEFNE